MKRFDCIFNECGRFEVEERCDGDWVYYEDARNLIKELEAENKRLREIVRESIPIVRYDEYEGTSRILSEARNAVREI